MTITYEYLTRLPLRNANLLTFYYMLQR